MVGRFWRIVIWGYFDACLREYIGKVLVGCVGDGLLDSQWISYWMVCCLCSVKLIVDVLGELLYSW